MLCDGVGVLPLVSDPQGIHESPLSICIRQYYYMDAVGNFDRKNGIAVHAWDMGHRPDWEAAEISEVEPRYLRRRVLEAIWIKNTLRVCNLDCGMAISEAWTVLT